jgi:hypothetical protein
VPKLAAGESHRATIDYAVHVGAQDVGDVLRRIAAIQTRQKPVINREPEKKD